MAPLLPSPSLSHIPLSTSAALSHTGDWLSAFPKVLTHLSRKRVQCSPQGNGTVGGLPPLGTYLH